MEKLGNECKLYIGPAGTTTSGATLVPKVRDNEMPLSASTVDRTSRADGGWKGQRTGLKEWGASFDMVYDPEETSWQQLRQAFFANTSIGVSILDGEGGEGIQGKCYVSEFTRGEPLDGIVTTKVTLIGDGQPTWTS